MTSKISKDTNDALRHLKRSSNVLDRLEDRFKSSFSPTRKNYQARLVRLTKRLESIELPDSEVGRELSTRIQSTIDELTDNLNDGLNNGFNNSADGFDKLPLPRFSRKKRPNFSPNFSKEISRIRRLGKKIALDSETSGPDALNPKTFSAEVLGHGLPGNCGCPLCACASDKDAAGKSGEFNAIGGNDNFGRNFGKWAQPGGKGTAVDVSFSFAKDFNAPGLTLNRAKTLFTEALQVWSDYAPLNFREVADPGDGNQVDIRVTDKFIDGNFGTLAFAYFPKGGDITFDNGERWRDDLFLETAVHEIGHAIGLGHDNSVSAIMNSSIKNRYSGEAFLLQDDIRGVRSIYGSGKGSVRRLGGQPAPNPTPTPPPNPTPNPTPPPNPAPNPTPNPTPPPRPNNKNLVVNGSFENSPVADNQFRVLPRIQGWTLFSGSGIQVERRNQFGRAAKGDAWVELDSNSNSTMYQNIDEVTGGGSYKFSFKYSPRQGLSADTNKIQVFWEGRLIDTVTKAGGNRNQWQTFSYDVKGDSNRRTPTIAFRAVGRNDKVGGFIDDVVVKQVVTRGAAAQSYGQSDGQLAKATADPLATGGDASALFAAADTGFSTAIA